jgi:hypothetical protein
MKTVLCQVRFVLLCILACVTARSLWAGPAKAPAAVQGKDRAYNEGFDSRFSKGGWNQMYISIALVFACLLSACSSSCSADRDYNNV